MVSASMHQMVIKNIKLINQYYLVNALTAPQRVRRDLKDYDEDSDDEGKEYKNIRFFMVFKIFNR